MLFELTGFQRDLLYVISGLEKESGQTIKEQFEKDYDEEIKHGRLYPNLDTLVDANYVEKGQIDRRTNYYQITDLGQEKLKERQNWENQFLSGKIHA